MRSRLAWASLALFATSLLTGCAGGWRHGEAPGGVGGATPDAKVAAAPASASRAAASPGLPAADGMTFMYRGAATSVALAGDFNAWSTSADPMTRQADGSWTLVKRLEPGRHLYKFVIDGGTWKEDPDAAEFADDGYGGKNSVVVVVASGEKTPAVTGTVPATTPAAGKGQAPTQTADGVTFTYAGPAGTVNLAGDFNAWSTTADPMVKQSDGTWTMTKKLAPGKYAYKFLVDGTAWKQDEANSVSTSDPYGGKNSVCTVK